MVITNYGKEFIAAVFGGSLTTPNYFAVGSGSGTAVVTGSALIYEVNRNACSSPDLTTAKKVSFIADFTAGALSGTNVSEFGLFGVTSGGMCLSRDAFSSVTFDGSNEAQIELTIEIY